MPINTRDEFTKPYIVKTVFGPYLRVNLCFSKNTSGTYISGYNSIKFTGEISRKPELKNLSLEHDGTVESLFNLIAGAENEKVTLRIEKEIYDLFKNSHPDLIKYLHSDNPKIRESAAALLRWIPGGTSAINEIASLASDTSSREGKESLYTLNYLILRYGKKVEIENEIQPISQMLEAFILDVCSNTRYSGLMQNCEPQREIISLDTINILPFNIGKLSEDLLIKTANEDVTFRYSAVDKIAVGDATRGQPQILFHEPRIFGDYLRMSFVCFFNKSNLHSDSLFWEMNYVALFRKDGNSWRLMSMPPYSGKYNTWANYSNINPLTWRKFDKISPVEYERFFHIKERIKVFDIMKSVTDGDPDFTFKYVGLKGEADKLNGYSLCFSKHASKIDERYVDLLNENLNSSSPNTKAAIVLSLAALNQTGLLPHIVECFLKSTNDDYINRSCKSLLLTMVKGKATKELESEIKKTVEAYLMNNHEGKIESQTIECVEQKYAIFEFCSGSGHKTGFALFLILNDGQWKVIDKCTTWIE